MADLDEILRIRFHQNLLECLQKPKRKWMLLMLYCLHHQNQHRVHCHCLLSSSVAENDEVVAEEDFIEVGIILAKTWFAL